MNIPFLRRVFVSFLLVVCSLTSAEAFITSSERATRREEEKKVLTKQFEWWPTDAQPSAVQDSERGGFWWMPRTPGKQRPWGNRGYLYVYKIIFDYQEEELPPAKAQELRPSLLIRKIVKNIKVYFDYDKADLRQDATRILQDALGTLRREDELSILITGNADIRGSEQYNDKLARRRGETVKDFMLQSGIPEDRIRVVSRGKLDAIAPVTDLVGMQKDRNAQFMIAEVEEVMLPAPGAPRGENVQPIEDGNYLQEEEQKLESEVQVSTREYVVRQGDTLSSIAKSQMGSAHRWNYLWQLNKGRVKNPDRLTPGQKLIIPVE